MYKHCIQQGCTPSDFWQMTVSEVYVYMEAKQPVQYYSGMSESDVDELLEMTKAETKEGEEFI